jgi:hypothetical protein
LWFGYRGSRIKLIPDTDGERIVTDFRQHGPAFTVGRFLLLGFGLSE